MSAVSITVAWSRGGPRGALTDPEGRHLGFTGPQPTTGAAMLSAQQLAQQMAQDRDGRR